MKLLTKYHFANKTMKLSHTHNAMKMEQHSLNNVTTPDDFEEGVLTRTLLSQMPLVNAPDGFEDAVMNGISADIPWKKTDTPLGQLLHMLRYNKAIGISAAIATISISVWIVVSLIPEHHTQQIAPKNTQVSTQTPASMHTQPAASLQQSSAKQNKTISPARQYHNAQKMIKNDTSPIPGFKTESKGEHEED